MKRVLTYNNNIISAGESILNIDYNLKKDLRYLIEFDDTIVNYTIIDSAGNYNFTYPNGLYGGLGVDGKINKCVKFQDSDTYPFYFMDNINTSGLNNQYDFNKTFTFWFRPWGHYNTYFYNMGYSEGGIVRSLTLKLDVYNRLNIIYDSSTSGADYTQIVDQVLNMDDWYFIVLRYNGRSDIFDVFINDSLFTFSPEEATNFDTEFYEELMYFGESQCYIDQSGFWDRSLSDYAIKQIYNHKKGLPYSQW